MWKGEGVQYLMEGQHQVCKPLYRNTHTHFPHSLFLEVSCWPSQLRYGVRVLAVQLPPALNNRLFSLTSPEVI